MVKKHGSYEGFQEYMRTIASKGGKLGRTGGFGAGEKGRELARRAGKIGGSKSKRGHLLVDDEYIKKG